VKKEHRNDDVGGIQHVVPFMKKLPVVYSGQPYQPGQERKRAIQTEPHQKSKAKKTAQTKTAAQTKQDTPPEVTYTGSLRTEQRDDEAPRSERNSPRIIQTH
jgi:hypothetical protein